LRNLEETFYQKEGHMALADAGIKIEDYLWYQKAQEKTKLETAVNLVKKGKFNIEDIADVLGKDVNFVLKVKERIAKGEL